jgi:ribonuclease P protein component
MKREAFPRGERLRARPAIQHLMKEGKASEDSLLVIKYLPAPDPAARRRILFAVSRSCRGAVERNRMRRRLREIYRHRRNVLPVTGNFLVIAKDGALRASFQDLVDSFERLSDAFAD